MSTKIRDGKRLAKKVDPFDFIASLPAVMKPIKIELDTKLLLDSAIQGIDDADLSGNARKSKPMMYAYIEYNRSQKKLPADEVDDPNRFALFFFRDPYTKRHLILPNAPEEAYGAALDQMDGIENYAYWDDSDRDENVSEYEWSKRKASWERAFPTSMNTSAEASLQYRLTSSASLDFKAVERLDHDVLHAWAPNTRTRANRIASALWCEHRLSLIEPGDAKEQDKLNVLMSAIHDDEEIDVLASIIEPRLAPVNAATLYDGYGESAMAGIREAIHVACVKLRRAP